jgi:hypothetical protein
MLQSSYLLHSFGTVSKIGEVSAVYCSLQSKSTRISDRKTALDKTLTETASSNHHQSTSRPTLSDLANSHQET